MPRATSNPLHSWEQKMSSENYSKYLRKKTVERKVGKRPGLGKPRPGEVRQFKLLDLGVDKAEAERLAPNVRESRKVIENAKKKVFNNDIRGLVDINEGDGPDQINIKAICKFERQRDILRRLLQQGVKLDEAVPLAEEAGESQEPLDKVTARRFVKEQLRRIKSSTDEIKVKGGGTRRRFRKLIVRGINVDKARVLCQKSWDTNEAIFALRGIKLKPKPKSSSQANGRPRNETTTRASNTSQRDKYKYVRPGIEVKPEFIPSRRPETKNETGTRPSHTTKNGDNSSQVMPRSSRNGNETTTKPHTRQNDRFKYVRQREEVKHESISSRRTQIRNKTTTRPYNRRFPQESIHGRDIMEPQQNYNYAESEELLQQKQKELALELLLDLQRQQLLPHEQNHPDHQFLQGSMPGQASKLAVIAPDFPFTIWSAQMLKGIQQCITKTAQADGIDLSDGGATCSFRPGWILYTTHDERIAQWFRLKVINLRPFDTLITVVDENQVPRSELFVAYIPEQRDISTDDLLLIIGKQNNDLRTQDWNVTNIAQRGPILELNVVVDPFSATALKQNNYAITYGYMSACMKPRETIKPPVESLLRNSTIVRADTGDDTFHCNYNNSDNSYFSARALDHADFSRAESDYVRSSLRDDDYGNFSRREDHYVDNLARSFVEGTADVQAPIFGREDDFAPPSIREENYARHSTRDYNNARYFQTDCRSAQHSRRNEHAHSSRIEESRSNLNQRGQESYGNEGTFSRNHQNSRNNTESARNNNWRRH